MILKAQNTLMDPERLVDEPEREDMTDFQISKAILNCLRTYLHSVGEHFVCRF
jgi:hypothetical protein